MQRWMTRATMGVFGLLLGGLPAVGQTLSDDDLPFTEDANGEKVPLFMHEGTFANNNGFGWARDNVELEAAFTLTGIDGRALYELLIDDDLENFERVQAGENWRGGVNGRRLDNREGQEIFSMDAFTVGYRGMTLDEVPWGSTHHAIREGYIPWESETQRAVEPYVWITIEGGNYEIDREDDGTLDPRWGGRRRVDLGTDTMDDIYFDTDDFSLLGDNMSIRARKRFRSETEIRRVLIALKLDRGVDEFGIKSAAKIDVRDDSVSDDDLVTMIAQAQRGLSSWDDRPAIPLRRAWKYLKDRGRLPSSPTYNHVLAMKPKAFIRSFRARFHFNEISLREIERLYQNGRDRIEALRVMANEALADGAVDAGRVAEVEAFSRKARGILDNTLVVERAFDRLRDLNYDASVANVTSLLPVDGTRIGRGQSLDDIAARKEILEQRRAIAETLSDLMHEVSRDLDDGSAESLRRVITRTLDRDLEDDATRFVSWQKATHLEELGRFQGMDKFVELHEGMLGDAAALQAFNDAGVLWRDEGIEDNDAWEDYESVLGDDDDWEDFEPLTQEQFDALRFHLRNEQVRIWMRQIEAAGSAARGIWFDEAREFYVPSSRRETGNFLIDTIDFPTMYDADVWGDTAEGDKNPSVDLNTAEYREHLIHSALVNEVQIELTSAGAEYPKRLRELRSMADLPRWFMKWCDSEGVSDYRARYDEFIALPSDNEDAELQTRLAPMNELIEANGGRVLNYQADEFRTWLDPDMLRDEVKDDAYELPNIEAALEGAKFVFDSYRDMLAFLAKLKRPRIMEVLDRADAPDTIDWVPSTASKGQMALGLLRDAAGVNTGGGSSTGGPTGGGLIDVLTGNNGTSASAATVQRQAYPDLEVEANIDDWYKLDLAPGESARFSITFSHAAGDLDMELYRDEGGSLTRFTSSESTSDEEAVEYTTSSGRTVWVRVYGYNGADGGYDLRVE